jgi:hypothetical protein
MPLAPSANAAKNKQHEDGAWLELIEINAAYTDANGAWQTDVFRLANNSPQDVAWNNQAWTAARLTPRSFAEAIGENPRYGFVIEDVDRAIRARLEDSWGGRKSSVVVYRIHSSQLGSTTPAATTATVEIASISIDKTTVSIELGTRNEMDRRAPAQIVSELCTWKTRAECQFVPSNPDPNHYPTSWHDAALHGKPMRCDMQWDTCQSFAGHGTEPHDPGIFGGFLGVPLEDEQ